MTIREALEKANAQITTKIDDAMTKEVFEEVRDEEAAVIYEEVYKVYKPKIYRRRGEYGGLGDPYNIEIRGGAAQGGKMIVVNTTQPNPAGCAPGASVTTGKDLPGLVEFGSGYRYYQYDFPKKGAAYMRPRPFTAKTIENLRKSRAHVLALKEGLKRQGVDVK